MTLVQLPVFHPQEGSKAAAAAAVTEDVRWAVKRRKLEAQELSGDDSEGPLGSMSEDDGMGHVEAHGMEVRIHPCT